MQVSRYKGFVLFFIILCQTAIVTYGQLGVSFDIKKPKEYEERVLKSERSEEKKFTLPRRFVQNTFTHYNYFFNANNKLNEVLERAKAAHKDDYSELLSFYNYSLDETASDSIQLDSIQYKTQTGIALHDLRNDWIDNLYLIWGASYYLKKEFDTAYLMFQFINYAFAEKEKDGYYKNIGSGMDGNNAFSISTKEKKSLPKKIFSEPPSRNDAFIWQIRNFLAQDHFAEAASLIVTLRNDPLFPKRLKDDLHEVQAYWFYKQNMWDSAAHHLVLALDAATTKQEKARWEYLAAQLYELAGNYKQAENFYAKSIKHTTDPIMDIYARLNSIRVNKDGGENYIEKNIAQLLRMAKRDKYQDYRDIIYYMAAQMELERNNPDATFALLLKSSKYRSDDVTQRNRTFLQLAELAYKKKEYRLAYNFYDSLILDDPALKNVDAITDRKDILGRLATAAETIERQDSLQHIASLPEDERKDFVRKLVRQLRKQQGLKDEGVSSPLTSSTPTTASQIFGGESKGEWYFYNASNRSRGANDFKAKWGNRPNVDNWRRSDVIGANINMAGNNKGDQGKTGNNQAADGELTFDALYENLPLTDEEMLVSNDSVKTAMYDLGKIYIQEIEDCSAGTETYENLRKRFPEFDKMDEVLFNLYYCYHKNGETAKAEQIKKLMSEKFPESNYTVIVTTGKNPQSSSANPDATKAYEEIYDLFLEGKFDEAISKKKIADDKFGKNYWTPQLLYIEAVYYIKQRNDSTAINSLKSILTQFPKTPLAAKASIMIDVLNRRTEIEEELRNLVVTRPKEETKPVNVAVNNKPPVSTNNPPVQQPPQQPVTNNPNTIRKTNTDSTKQSPVQPLVSPFTYTPDASHYVVLILTKVDPVFVNEAKNAFFRYNRETHYNKIMTTEIVNIDADNRFLLISPFKNVQEAIAYIDKAKPVTATEIIPWLKGGRYAFSVITDKNLDLLKVNQDLENYKNFLNQQLPGKF